MIGSGPLASGLASAILVAALLGGGAADPEESLRADELVGERSIAALDALDALISAFSPALEAARNGSALVVQGDESPGARLQAAAEMLEGATGEAESADRALAALDGARRARDPDALAFPPVVGPAELEEIADTLRAAAPQAEAVAELRHRVAEVLDRTGRALAALVAERHAEARREVDAARTSFDAVTVPAGGGDAFIVWLGTTDAMITAVTSLIDASAAGDSTAMASAAADFAAVAEDAPTADRALRIAIAERAAAATGAAMSRIGEASARREQLRGEIASEASRP